MTSASVGVAVVSRAFGAIACASIVFMALATFYDVAARYLFNKPTVWATEISTYVLIVTIFLGAASVHLADGHVRVDLMINAVNKRTRRILLMVSAWIAMLFVAISAWQAILLTINEYETGTRLFSVLLTPGWIPKLPIAIGLTALSTAFLVEIERIADQPSPWRRWLPYLLFGLVVLPFLLYSGTKPPNFLGTRFDQGSLVVLLAVYIGAFATGGLRVGLAVALVTGGSIAAFHLGKGAGLGFITVCLFLCIALCLAIGVRIAFALGFVGALTIYFLTPAPFPVTIAERAFSSVNSFALTAVPLYVMMGSLLVRSGLSAGLFSVLARFLSRFPGGLAHPAVAGCAIFAAVSGSSVATAATIGSVACPEMNKRGYDPRLSYGAIAAGGTLGILIPPSVPLIIYGIIVGVPITTLFIAGIGPGILIATLFATMIYLWGKFDPKAAPSLEVDMRPAVSRADSIDTGIVVLLIFLVIASLYGGFATASETGAIAAVCAFIACALRRRLNWDRFRSALGETVVVTSFIFLIVVGANTVTFGFDYLKISQSLMEAVTDADANRWLILTIILVVYLVLGMFLDSISMMVLTLPVVFPLSQLLGFDPVWFGIVVVITAEIGLITPPVGMNLFVLQGIDRNVSLRQIAAGAIPFIGVMLLSILLLCFLPEIALLLTRYLN